MKNLISKIFMLVVIATIGILFSSSTPICPQGNPDITYLYPYPDDCRKFYECDNGMLSIYNCPDGLLFCTERGACEYADSPACSYGDCMMNGGGDIQGIVCEYSNGVKSGRVYISCGEYVNGNQIKCGEKIYNEKGKDKSKCFR